ncbi:hypothetical protein CKA32_006752 [Geitlerinema sp. FC II]|nr:hypothetical protein CKA32_006752 [Geitlerinema sp. FC II]
MKIYFILQFIFLDDRTNICFLRLNKTSKLSYYYKLKSTKLLIFYCLYPKTKKSSESRSIHIKIC